MDINHNHIYKIELLKSRLPKKDTFYFHALDSNIKKQTDRYILNYILKRLQSGIAEAVAPIFMELCNEVWEQLQ